MKGAFKPQFTKGPWKRWLGHDEIGAHVRTNTRGEFGADIVCALEDEDMWDAPESERVANGRLICAAPSVFERLNASTHMLQNLVSDMRKYGFSEQAIKNTQSVIAKNEAALSEAVNGQSDDLCPECEQSAQLCSCGNCEDCCDPMAHGEGR